MYTFLSKFSNGMMLTGLTPTRWPIQCRALSSWVCCMPQGGLGVTTFYVCLVAVYLLTNHGHGRHLVVEEIGKALFTMYALITWKPMNYFPMHRSFFLESSYIINQVDNRKSLAHCVIATLKKVLYCILSYCTLQLLNIYNVHSKSDCYCS